MTDATHRPKQTNATPTEKLEAPFNEQKLRSAQRRDEASTFHQFGQSQASEEGGRFAKPQHIIGTDSAVHYPTAGPNWSADPTGVEPPLNYDINETPIVSETWEVEASLDGNVAAASAASPHNPGLSPSALPSSDLAAVDAPLTVNPSVDVERPQPSPTPKRRRRR
jgi:hypothetical protein